MAEYQLLVASSGERNATFDDTQWRHHEALFARLLRGDEWATVADAYQALRALSRDAAGVDPKTALEDVNRARKVMYRRGAIEGTGVGLRVPQPRVTSK